MSEGMSAPVASPSAPASGQSVPSQLGQNNNPGNQAKSGGPENPSQSGQPASPPETREYKIDGKMVKLTQKEADEYVAMSGAAKARFHEAARKERELEAREQQYAKNPIQALKDYCKKAGYSPEQTREAIEDMYEKEYIKYDTMTAEQRELEELKQYKAQREAEVKEREANEHKTYEQKMTADQVNHITQEIVSALESSPIPVTDDNKKFLVQRMAWYTHENNKNGWDAPKEMVLKQVVKEYTGIVGGFLKSPVEKIISSLGDDGQAFIDSVLKYSLDKLRSGRNKLQEPFAGSSANNAPHPSGKIGMDEVNRRLRDMRSGKFVGSS